MLGISHRNWLDAKKDAECTNLQKRQKLWKFNTRNNYKYIIYTCVCVNFWSSKMVATCCDMLQLTQEVNRQLFHDRLSTRQDDDDANLKLDPSQRRCCLRKGFEICGSKTCLHQNSW